MNIVKKCNNECQKLVRKMLREIFKSEQNFKQFNEHLANYLRDKLRPEYNYIPSFLFPLSIDNKIYRLSIVKYVINPSFRMHHVPAIFKYSNVAGIKRITLTSKQILDLFILYSFHKNCKFVRYLSKYSISYIQHKDGTHQISNGVHVRYNLGLNHLKFYTKYVDKSISLIDSETNKIIMLNDFKLVYDGSWLYVAKIPKEIRFKHHLINRIINAVTTKNMSKLIHYYSRYPF